MAYATDFLSASRSVANINILTPCVAPAIHRLGGAATGSQTFAVRYGARVGAEPVDEALTIGWSVESLLATFPNLAGELEALRTDSHMLAEKATEYAGYAIAIAAVAAFMPGRLVTHVNVGRAPDLLLGLGMDRGIEVAARMSGRSAFDSAVRTKRAALLARDDLVESHLSVWALDLIAGHKERVR